MTELPRSEIAAIRIDKDNDIIPISVGLYKLFMASGAPGREAKDLYEHLIFTARLQETRTVRANNTYLARGLSWGIAKVKKAKAWLAQAGLIEYVRSRGSNGRVEEIYIMLRFLPRAETVASKLGLLGDDVPPTSVERAADEEYRDDLTPSLFEEEYGFGAEENEQTISNDHTGATTGTEVEPVVTTGSNINPVDNHAHGAEQQMLKASSEMLEVRKGKGEAPACPPLIKIQDQEERADAPHLAIAAAWYRRYARETGIMIMPRSDDHKAGHELYRAVSGDLSGLDAAIEAYFGRFRELDLWFAAKKASRGGDKGAWVPEWSFRTFVARYPEIVAATTERRFQEAKARGSGAVSPERHERICPVCGRRLIGTLASCPGCGFDWADAQDPAKVHEHAEWWVEKNRKSPEHLDLVGKLVQVARI